MTADFMILNGRVLTLDGSRPQAEAIAVKGNRILDIGTSKDIAAFKSASTRVIDAQGGSVLPGFIEGHMHLFSGAAELDNLNLYGVQGFKDLARALATYAAKRPERKLLIANQVNYGVLSEGEALTRRHLDKAVPDRPLLCVAPDHHTAWANTAALSAAGILR